MIEVKNIEKSFGFNKALKGVSFNVKQGEVLGFLGPNGAGKTTTLKIITSFWPQDEGSVVVNGLDTISESLESRKQIGYLPESVPLYDEMTVYEYLKFMATVRNIKRSEVKDSIKRASRSCGLDDVVKKPVGELSKGYRQRVGLAQAMIGDPEVLILDEPTTGLDPNQIAEIRELIKKIGEKKTVIFSTHILSEVSATCDRVVIISGGEIVGSGTPRELTQKVDTEEAMIVKIKGNENEILEFIKNMEGVRNAKLVRANDKEGHQYEITPDPNKDITKELTSSLVAKGWGLVELKRIEKSLEDVFKQLTS